MTAREKSRWEAKITWVAPAGVLVHFRQHLLHLGPEGVGEGYLLPAAGLPVIKVSRRHRAGQHLLQAEPLGAELEVRE